MAPTVLITGSGIAGPVLAVLLKRKGYNPIVFEKVRQLGDAGGSLMLMPNGLKVLNLVDLANEIEKGATPLEGFLDCSSDGQQLGLSDLPKSFKQRYGHPAMGVRRTELNLKLKEMLQVMDIELREGWELQNFEEQPDSVTAHFKNGRSETGAFLVGCDGIKAASRKLLLAKKGATEGTPSFTGLTQTGGFSPTPMKLQNEPRMRNWYGEGVHIVAYPVSKRITSWAVTLPEEKGTEADWGIIGANEMEARKSKLLASLELWKDDVPKKLVHSATRMIKFGLFDREELSSHDWYSKRVVLIGDAAHPTSPHLGQGANQALEDCWHLSNALPDLTAYSADNLDSLLPQIFKTFAEKRQPRTSALVKGARAQGAMRVVTVGTEACQRRNEQVTENWKDVNTVAARYDTLCREPF
jgi:salicylate hydroxylase